MLLWIADCRLGLKLTSIYLPVEGTVKLALVGFPSYDETETFAEVRFSSVTIPKVTLTADALIAVVLPEVKFRV